MMMMMLLFGVRVGEDVLLCISCNGGGEVSRVNKSFVRFWMQSMTDG
jgi:hypothetical protein